MFGSFGVLDNAEHLQIMNGVVTYTPTRPEFLTALRYFNRLYSEGLMDAEGFSQSFQQYNAKGRAVPMLYGSFIHGEQANVIGANRLDDYTPVVPLKGPTGIQLWNQARSTGVTINGFAISTKCKNPDTLVRWYDYINSSLEMVLFWELGPRGVSWDWTYVNGNQMWKQLDGNIPAGSSWGEFRHTVGVGSNGPQCGEAQDRNNPIVRTIEDANTLNKIASVALQEPFLVKEVLPFGLEDPAIIRDRAILYADIDSYVRNFIATSVMNGITDAQWNEHLRNTERLNIPAYVKTYQALYDRSKK